MMMLEAVVIEILALQLVLMQVVEQTARERGMLMLTRQVKQE